MVETDNKKKFSSVNINGKPNESSKGNTIKNLIRYSVKAITSKFLNRMSIKKLAIYLVFLKPALLYLLHSHILHLKVKHND